MNGENKTVSLHNPAGFCLQFYKVVDIKVLIRKLGSITKRYSNDQIEEKLK